MIAVNKAISSPQVSFNPAFYRQTVALYKKGDLKRLVAMFETAELDSQVSGCMIGRYAGFSRDWRLTEASNSKEDLMVKDFAQGVLMDLNMKDLFEDIFDAKKNKYSVIALDWEVKNQKQIITKAKKLHQRYFRYKDDVLCLDFGKDLKEIPQDSALVCEYRRNPILLPVLRDYILKEFGLESWASFIEVFGEAFVIGTYPPGADDNFRKELEDAVNKVASSTRGVKPEGSSLDIIESHRTTGDHEKFVDRADKAISISILGHANAVNGNKGGLQVGDDQSSYRVRREIAVDDITFIEQYCYQLVKKLVDRNFTVGKYPLFTIDKSEPINIKDRLAVLDSAYEKGFKIHPDEYGKLGLYVYEDQEPLQNPLVFGD
jgi:phage gp29-like protein